MNTKQKQNRITCNVEEGKLPENISAVEASLIVDCLNNNGNIGDLQEVGLIIVDADKKPYSGEVTIEEIDFVDVLNGVGVKLSDGLSLTIEATEFPAQVESEADSEAEEESADEQISESEPVEENPISIFLYEKEKTTEVMKALQEVMCEINLDNSAKIKGIASSITTLTESTAKNTASINNKADNTGVNNRFTDMGKKIFNSWIGVGVSLIISICLIIVMVASPSEEDLMTKVEDKLRNSNFTTTTKVTKQIDKAFKDRNISIAKMNAIADAAVEPIKQSVASFYSDILDVETEMDTLTKKVKGIEKDVKPLKKLIKTLETDIDTLEVNLEKTDKFAKDTERRVTSQGSRLNGIDKTLEDQNATIQQINESIVSIYSLEATLNAVVHNQALLQEAECDDWSSSEKICVVIEDGWKKVVIIPVENNATSENNSSTETSENNVTAEADTSVDEDI
ncbi:hypothetical protein ACFLY2_01005 [Patescibacteria group bacterium]